MLPAPPRPAVLVPQAQRLILDQPQAIQQEASLLSVILSVPQQLAISTPMLAAPPQHPVLVPQAQGLIMDQPQAIQQEASLLLVILAAVA